MTSLLNINHQNYTLQGTFNYKEIVDFKGEQRTITICHIFHFNENSFYIDYKMSNFGIGQFSMYCSHDGEALIGNEETSLYTSMVILKVLDNGLKKQKNPEIDYLLSKFLYNIDPECLSLDHAINMLWKYANKERHNVESKTLPIPIELGHVKIIESSLEKDYANEEGDEQAFYFKLDIDVSGFQFGEIVLIQEENSPIEMTISKGLKKETLIECIKVLLKTEEQQLTAFYPEEKINTFKKAQLNLNDFLLNCNLTGTIEEIVNKIFNNKKENSRYKIH